MHLRHSYSQSNFSDADQPGLEIDEPRASDELVQARFVGLGDSSYALRIAWLDRWLTCEKDFLYRQSDTRLLSQADSSWDVIVLHGEDARRLAAILRDFRRVYRDKLMIAVLTSSTPALRAITLRAGADAVFSIDSPHEVAAAWLGSAMARQARMQDVKEAEERKLQSQLATSFGSSFFTPQESRLLSLFEDNAGRVVAYHAIARTMGRPLSDQCMRAMRTAICMLNKKIDVVASIRNHRGAGYMLPTPCKIATVGKHLRLVEA